MKNKILILLLIVLITLFIWVIYIAVNNNNKINNDNSISNQRLKELFDNSYKYYLLYEGKITNDINITDLEIEETKYSKVDIFNNIEDIEEMVNITFTEKRKNDFYNAIFENRNYIQFGENLYVEYKKYCNNIDINFDNIIINKIEPNIISINCGNVIVHAYYENDNWYLDAPLHFCE